MQAQALSSSVSRVRCISFQTLPYVLGIGIALSLQLSCLSLSLALWCSNSSTGLCEDTQGPMAGQLLCTADHRGSVHSAARDSQLSQVLALIPS